MVRMGLESMRGFSADLNHRLVSRASQFDTKDARILLNYFDYLGMRAAPE